MYVTVLFHFLNRNLVFIKHGWLSRKSRSEEKFKHYQQMMKDGRDVSLLRMFDSSVESAPQLIIQIYIAMHHPSQESLHLGIYIYIKKTVVREYTICMSFWAIGNTKRKIIYTNA